MLLFPQHDRPDRGGAAWIEVRCAGCGRLLQKMEQQALRPGKHIQIKCAHCKVMNDLVGTELKTI